MRKRINNPSRLSDLHGNRRPRGQVNVNSSKPPKRRFNIGDIFEYDGSYWRLIYMYRVKGEIGWFHELEECEKPTELGQVFEILGAEATTPRICYDEFFNHNDASQFFSDIYRHGSRIVETTQELLKLKKL